MFAPIFRRRQGQPHCCHELFPTTCYKCCCHKSPKHHTCCSLDLWLEEEPNQSSLWTRESSPIKLSTTLLLIYVQFFWCCIFVSQWNPNIWLQPDVVKVFLWLLTIKHGWLVAKRYTIISLIFSVQSSWVQQKTIVLVLLTS